MNKPTKKPRVGRPPLPAAARRSDLVKLRATADEAARIDELAAALDVTRSEAVRLAVDEMLARVAKRAEAKRSRRSAKAKG